LSFENLETGEKPSGNNTGKKIRWKKRKTKPAAKTSEGEVTGKAHQVNKLNRGEVDGVWAKKKMTSGRMSTGEKGVKA